MNISRHEIEPGFSVETRYDPDIAAVKCTIREEGKGTVAARKPGEGTVPEDRGLTIIIPRSAFREAAVTEGAHPIPIMLDAFGVWGAANPNLNQFIDWIGRMDSGQLQKVEVAVNEQKQGIMEGGELES